MNVSRYRPRQRPRHLPPRVTGTPRLDLADIQGNLLRGYTYPVASYVFVAIGDAAAGRDWLRGLVGQVQTAEHWTEEPPSALNLALTYGGLEALGVPADILASFPEAFREGMASRADLLGDEGSSAPEHWEAGLGTGEAHVCVTLCASDEQTLDERLGELHDAIAAAGGAVTVVHEQRTLMMSEGRDHFGFKDGIAQPAIEGSGVLPRAGDGGLNSDGDWESLKPGEFVLGYVDGDGGLPEAPAAPFEKNATFVVYRKFHMDAAAFRRFVDDAAGDLPGGADEVAAKIVGRWRDGTPLCVSPGGPDPEIAGDPARINDFKYSDDQDGFRCPVGAHIRRMTPRDTEGFFGGKLTNRHRIIRRGRTYGPELPGGVTEDDGQPRGLIFKCYQADLERQFETLQTLWANDGDPFGLGADKDPLIGSGGGGKMTIQGPKPVFLARPEFTTVRGGEYLFRPSLRALHWLADPLT